MQSFVEIDLLNYCPVVPLKSPWTASMTFSITLRNSLTPVTFSRKIFSIPVSKAEDHLREITTPPRKWSILVRKDGHEMNAPMLFPDRISSEDISKDNISLIPDIPTKLVMFPFDSLDADSYLPHLNTFEQNCPHILQYNVSHITRYSRASKFAVKLHENKNPGGFAGIFPPIPIRCHGSWLFKFSESPITPWIEVHAEPASPALDISKPDEFSVILTLILRDIESPIVAPIYAGERSTTESVRHIGGWLTYMDKQTGDPLRRRNPQIFVNCFAKNKATRNLSWLMSSCYTLMPGQPLAIDQKLFEEERTDFHIAAEQFQEGSSYTIRLEHPRGMEEWIRGTLMGNVLFRIVTGHWFSEIHRESGNIPFFQTKSGSFTVIKS